MNDSPVTVLGLGDMGSALARALLRQGRPVTVWNRTAAKAAPLLAEGATVAPTAAEAVAAGRLVVVCLLDHDSVHRVLDPLARDLAGKALVNLVNGTPEQARATAGWAAAHGAGYLDGGVMAVPPMIGTPAAFLLYSGSPDVFTTHRTALDALGESHYLGEDAGRAALYDIALLSGMYGMIAGILHAYALVRTEQVPTVEFEPLLSRWLQGMSSLAPRFAERVDKGAHGDGVVSNLAMQSAGWVNLLRSARDAGISAELLAPLGELMARRVAAGHGDEDLSGLVEDLSGR